jgi:glutamyl-tRNA reductase
MSIVLLGLNHRSAPVEVRERLAFDAAQATAALRQLKETDRAAEFVLLSTRASRRRNRSPDG